MSIKSSMMLAAMLGVVAANGLMDFGGSSPYIGLGASHLFLMRKESFLQNNRRGVKSLKWRGLQEREIEKDNKT